MSKQIRALTAENSKFPSLNNHLAQYELLVEELAAENTKLIIENSALKKQDSIKVELQELKLALDKFKEVNQKLMIENDELRHKYEVSEKLYQMMKLHFSKYVNKSLTTDVSYED